MEQMDRNTAVEKQIAYTEGQLQQMQALQDSEQRTREELATSKEEAKEAQQRATAAVDDAHNLAKETL